MLRLGHHETKHAPANINWLRFLEQAQKSVDEKGTLIRTLARGELLNISKRDQAKLVPSAPERMKVIKHIFKMYAEQGKGYKSIAIAYTLNQEGIASPRGPKWSHIYSGKWTPLETQREKSLTGWTDTTIRAILVNPIYAGDMVWNRRPIHPVRSKAPEGTSNGVHIGH